MVLRRVPLELRNREVRRDLELDYIVAMYTAESNRSLPITLDAIRCRRFLDLVEHPSRRLPVAAS